ncbi:MAG: hypothetical protein JNM63_05585, partial [Spirochaetia bacterium]|nr:hypothetical protein [Spirochaetia bacterium]
MRHSFTLLIRAGLLFALGLSLLYSGESNLEKSRPTFIMVVLDFANGTEDPEIGRQAAEIVRVIIPDFPRFRVVDRGVLRSALEAKRMQVNQVLDSGTGIEVARELKAEYLLVGSISKLLQNYSLNLKLIDTSSGTVMKAGGVEFRDMLEIR